MSDFERIVRPFQTGVTTPPQNVPPSPFIRSKNVILNPGSGGTCKTMGGSYSLTINYYMIKRPTEKTTGGGQYAASQYLPAGGQYV